MMRHAAPVLILACVAAPVTGQLVGSINRDSSRVSRTISFGNSATSFRVADEVFIRHNQPSLDGQHCRRIDTRFA